MESYYKLQPPVLNEDRVKQAAHTTALSPLNTLRSRQNGRHFAYDTFKCIFLNENVWIPIEISLKFVPRGSINNNRTLFQIMAWRPPGDKPLSEPMMVSSLTHICVTRPQWVKIQSSFAAQGLILLQRSNAVAIQSANNRAVFNESCAPIGWKSCGRAISQ